MKKRIFASLLALVMAFSLLPASALAGKKPVTITVRVFDLSTYAAYTVGTDTAGAGNPGQIQSEDYKIPQLTKFVDASKFGRVTKVAGNWYFPSGDQQPGATVNWSTNNGNSTMTYWVDRYTPDGGSPTSSLWNFTLKYDANGGTGAPADQTYGTNEKYVKSYSFTIPTTVPTRKDYIFKGWSDGKTTYQPGNKCLVSQTVSGYNGGSVTKTLSAVWEEGTPSQPVTNPSIRFQIVYTDAQYGVVKLGKVSEPVEFKCQQSTCKGANELDHSMQISVIKNQGIPAVQATLTSGEMDGYAFDGWMKKQPTTRVSVNNTTYPMWSLDKTGNTAITLMESNDRAEIFLVAKCQHSHDSNGYCTVAGCTHSDDCCPKKPSAPNVPSKDNLTNVAFTITCVNENATHDYKNTRSVLLNDCRDAYSIEPNEVQWDDENSVYYINLKVTTAPYVEYYSKYKASVEHTLYNKEQTELTFRLRWNASSKLWEEFETPTLEVTCESQPTTTYTVTFDGNGRGDKVANVPDSMTYTGSETYHIFDLPDTIPVRNGYVFQGWAASADASKAFYQPGKTITVQQGNPAQTLYAVWTEHEHKDNDGDGFCDDDNACMHPKDNEGCCTVDGCTHPDTCCPKKTEPGPTQPDEDKLYDAIDNTLVLIQCETKPNDHQTIESRISAVDSTRSGIQVNYSGNGTVATVTITNPKDYAAVYTVKNVTHKYKEDGSRLTFTLEWRKDDTSGNWDWYLTSASPLVNTVCESTPEEYTVHYDLNGGKGASGVNYDDVTVSAGDKITVLAAPTRSGYTFKGWKAGNTTYQPGDKLTVKGAITFTAQWSKDSSHDDDDYDYTLRYVTNGGKAISSESKSRSWVKDYEDLPVPTRVGYRFNGWYYDTKLTKAVTGDVQVSSRTVTLYAGWTENSVPAILNGDDHFAYIQGYDDGTVRPNTPVTRAQVATILFRLLDEDVRDKYLTETNTFTDVAADYWANTAISTMASLGVFKGRTADRFDPNAPITRGEFAAVCARFDDSSVQSSNAFSDIDGYWAKQEILRAAALGWVQGYQDGTFRPTASITRAQVVTMINRVLCRQPETASDLLRGMTTFTDCAEGDWCYLAIQEAANSHDYVGKSGSIYESWTDLNKSADWSKYEH